MITIKSQKELSEYVFCGFIFYEPLKSWAVRYEHDSDWFIFPKEFKLPEGRSVSTIELITWLQNNRYYMNAGILYNMQISALKNIWQLPYDAAYKKIISGEV